MMEFNRTFTVKTLRADRQHPSGEMVRQVDWEIVLVSQDPAESSIGSRHEGRTDLPEDLLIPVDSVTDELVEERVLQAEGGNQFLDMLAEIAETHIRNALAEDRLEVIYDVTTSQPADSDDGPSRKRIRRVGPFEVWEMIFRKGDVMQDIYPLEGTPAFEATSPGEWISKPTASFVRSGEFHLTMHDGLVYRLDDTIPPRKWMQTRRFKYEAKTDNARLMCIMAPRDAVQLISDYEQMALAEGERHEFLASTEDRYFHIREGALLDVLENEGLEAVTANLYVIPADKPLIIEAVEDTSLVVISNTRPWQLEKHEGRPPEFDHAILGTAEDVARQEALEAQYEEQRRIQSELTAFVQNMLDEKASERNYDGILSLASYAVSTNPKFAAEGKAGAQWRDAVWAKSYQIMEQVVAGHREVPTKQQLLALLPKFEWPEV